jgi:predicted dehydrogenase
VPHRIGIVGCGGIAHRHLEGYGLVLGERGVVVAGCDPIRETLDAFCDRWHLPHRFTSPADMIASGEVGVISLLTPPAVRAEVILPALERGIAVLVEKPFAERLDDALRFVEAAERAGAAIAVNQQLRFMPDLLRAREVIQSGALGALRLIAHDQLQHRVRTAGWRKDERRLEISIFSVHLLDRIRWLAASRPRAVSAVTRRWSEAVRGETFTALTVQFESGAVGTMVSNWHSPGVPECRLRVDGTDGSLLSVKEEVLADRSQLTIQRPGQPPSVEELDLPSAFQRCMGESMRRLLEAIDAGRPPVHSGRDNLDTMAIVDAAYLSAERGGALVETGELLPVAR